MAALGKMASGVAHEVNNPLMLIQENAGWISDLLSDEDRSKMKNYDEILASCDKIRANVQRARGITQRMLGFGRRMNPGRAEVMLSVVADHVEELLPSEATSHNVRIIKKYSSDVPVILSDPAQLEQVILNIIDNAIDAIGQNGTVTVTTGRTPNGGASIAISDTGPGLMRKQRARFSIPSSPPSLSARELALAWPSVTIFWKSLAGALTCRAKWARERPLPSLCRPNRLSSPL